MAGTRAEQRSILALDTTCLVALLCGWHEHHAATASALERRIDAGATLVLPAPALIEAYSVLTRLPAPHRLAPVDASQLLRQNFEQGARVASLSAKDTWSLLGNAPLDKVQGGRVYDAVMAACARKAGARELLTLNLRHFEGFADATLRVTSPLEPAAHPGS